MSDLPRYYYAPAEWVADWDEDTVEGLGIFDRLASSEIPILLADDLNVALMAVEALNLRDTTSRCGRVL
jgi:hypothetical protein